MTNSKLHYSIEGHPGRWSHEKTRISELGYIMVTFFNEETKVYLNVNMGLLEEALQLPWHKKENT